jgi:hypothetical protein
MPLLVSKPISLLERTLTVKWVDFWKALGRTVVHASTVKLDDLPGDLVDLGASLGLAEDPAVAAWVLIRRSLERALRDLVHEHRDLFAGASPAASEITAAEAGLSIEDEVLEIDEHFFEQPGALSLLVQLQQPLTGWLMAYGIHAPEAQAIAERLRAYFVYALHAEWAVASTKYARIHEAFNTPFTRANDVERAWQRYEAHLVRQTNEPMYGEAFGLQAVYVPLRGYLERFGTMRNVSIKLRHSLC